MGRELLGHGGAARQVDERAGRGRLPRDRRALRPARAPARGLRERVAGGHRQRPAGLALRRLLPPAAVRRRDGRRGGRHAGRRPGHVRRSARRGLRALLADLLEEAHDAHRQEVRVRLPGRLARGRKPSARAGALLRQGAGAARRSPGERRQRHAQAGRHPALQRAPRRRAHRRRQDGAPRLLRASRPEADPLAAPAGRHGGRQRRGAVGSPRRCVLDRRLRGPRSDHGEDVPRALPRRGPAGHARPRALPRRSLQGGAAAARALPEVARSLAREAEGDGERRPVRPRQTRRPLRERVRPAGHRDPEAPCVPGRRGPGAARGSPRGGGRLREPSALDRSPAAARSRRGGGHLLPEPARHRVPPEARASLPDGLVQPVLGCRARLPRSGRGRLRGREERDARRAVTARRDDGRRRVDERGVRRPRGKALPGRDRGGGDALRGQAPGCAGARRALGAALRALGPGVGEETRARGHAEPAGLARGDVRRRDRDEERDEEGPAGSRASLDRRGRDAARQARGRRRPARDGGIPGVQPGLLGRRPAHRAGRPARGRDRGPLRRGGPAVREGGAGEGHLPVRGPSRSSRSRRLRR